MTSMASMSSNSKSLRIPLALQVLLAALGGVLCGLYLGKTGTIVGISGEDLGLLGQLVIKLLKTLAAPLIFFSILDAFIHTHISLEQGKRFIIICLVNVSVAMGIGIFLINTLKPGESWRGKIEEMKSSIGLSSSSTTTSTTPNASPLLAHKKEGDPEAPPATLGLIKNLSYYIPSSIIKPFHYNTIISIVILGLLGGFSLRRVREKQRLENQDNYLVMEKFITTLYQMLMQILEWVILIVPFAVFAIVAQVVGAAGLGVFKMLWSFMAIILLGFFIHALLYYPLMAWVVGKIKPKVYLGQGMDAVLTGFSLNSSLATVPVTLKCLTEKMGVSPTSARLSACVGTNFNNDGITLYEAMTALFLSQALGMHLTFSQQMGIAATSVLAGAGVAGIPDAGLIILPMVLSSCGLPEEMVMMVIPLILPVDWVLARCRSAVNVLSDMLVAILLDSPLWGKSIDPEK